MRPASVPRTPQDEWMERRYDKIGNTFIEVKDEPEEFLLGNGRPRSHSGASSAPYLCDEDTAWSHDDGCERIANASNVDTCRRWTSGTGSEGSSQGWSSVEDFWQGRDGLVQGHIEQGGAATSLREVSALNLEDCRKYRMPSTPTTVSSHRAWASRSTDSSPERNAATVIGRMPGNSPHRLVEDAGVGACMQEQVASSQHYGFNQIASAPRRLVPSTPMAAVDGHGAWTSGSGDSSPERTPFAGLRQGRGSVGNRHVDANGAMPGLRAAVAWNPHDGRQPTANAPQQPLPISPTAAANTHGAWTRGTSAMMSGSSHGGWASGSGDSSPERAPAAGPRHGRAGLANRHVEDDGVLTRVPERSTWNPHDDRQKQTAAAPLPRSPNTAMMSGSSHSGWAGGSGDSSPERHRAAGLRQGHDGMAHRHSEDQEVVTTLMVRNLPKYITQSDLVQEIQASGFEGGCDFLYMPSCFESGAGCGYAFINFQDPEAASMFAEAWRNTQRFGMTGRSFLNISYKCIQGRDANVAKWCTSKTQRIRNPNFQPLVISPESGVLEPWSQVAKQGATRASQSDSSRPVHITPPLTTQRSTAHNQRGHPRGYDVPSTQHPVAHSTRRDGATPMPAPQTGTDLSRQVARASGPSSSSSSRCEGVDMYEQFNNYSRGPVREDGDGMARMEMRRSSLPAPSWTVNTMHAQERCRVHSTATCQMHLAPR